MRISVEIEGRVLEKLRALQRREGTTLGALAWRLLPQALAHEGGLTPKASLTWNAQPMRASIDLENKAAVLDGYDG